MDEILIFRSGGQEILFIALIALLRFGGKKTPESMKGRRKGVKSFKDGMNGTEEDAKNEENKEKE